MWRKIGHLSAYDPFTGSQVRMVLLNGFAPWKRKSIPFSEAPILKRATSSGEANR